MSEKDNAEVLGLSSEELSQRKKRHPSQAFFEAVAGNGDNEIFIIRNNSTEQWINLDIVQPFYRYSQNNKTSGEHQKLKAFFLYEIILDESNIKDLGFLPEEVLPVLEYILRYKSQVLADINLEMTINSDIWLSMNDDGSYSNLENELQCYSEYIDRFTEFLDYTITNNQKLTAVKITYLENSPPNELFSNEYTSCNKSINLKPHSYPGL
jgi:hypothetical protein